MLLDFLTTVAVLFVSLWSALPNLNPLSLLVTPVPLLFHYSNWWNIPLVTSTPFNRIFTLKLAFWLFLLWPHYSLLTKVALIYPIRSNAEQLLLLGPTHSKDMLMVQNTSELIEMRLKTLEQEEPIMACSGTAWEMKQALVTLHWMHTYWSQLAMPIGQHEQWSVNVIGNFGQ